MDWKEARNSYRSGIFSAAKARVGVRVVHEDKVKSRLTYLVDGEYRRVTVVNRKLVLSEKNSTCHPQVWIKCRTWRTRDIDAVADWLTGNEPPRVVVELTPEDVERLAGPGTLAERVHAAMRRGLK